MQTLAVSKGLKVPCPLHDSWANAKSCRDISHLFKDYSLFYPVWAQDWSERKHWPSNKHMKALKWLDREIQCGSIEGLDKTNVLCILHLPRTLYLSTHWEGTCYTSIQHLGGVKFLGKGDGTLKPEWNTLREMLTCQGESLYQAPDCQDIEMVLYVWFIHMSWTNCSIFQYVI